MFEPHLSDLHPGSANTYPQKSVLLAAQLRNGDCCGHPAVQRRGLERRRVIHCSLLPPGAVRCDIDGLFQARVKIV